jgi:hypothetical protein
LELLVEHERRDEVELVDDDVVARPKIEPVGDDVLGVTRRIENRDLVGRGAEQIGEALAHLLALLTHS